MNLLAIDTSGPVAGVAMFRDGRVIYEGAAVNRRTHSVNLLPMVEEALNRSATEIADVDLYAVVTGPGSFTGVRIGVSMVKGMAHGAGKPCVAVDALEALACGVGLSPDLLCPIQDARAGQVYGAVFTAGMPPLRRMEDAALKLDEYLDAAVKLARPDQKLLFTGDGVEPCRERILGRLGERASFAPAHMSYLRPAAVAALAYERQDEAVDYIALMPRYLRAPQAERLRAAKQKEANQAV